jgi:hypothetical protein
MEIFVRTLAGKQITVIVEPSDTVQVIADAIQNQIGIPTNMARILFAGKELAMGEVISSYSISKGSTLHVLLTMRGQSTTASNATPAAAPATPAAPKPDADLEKCWSLAYQEEWLKAKEFLESGKVTLDQLEQRCKVPLLTFLAIRDMPDALNYVIEKRGKPTCLEALHAANEAAVNIRMQSVRYFVNLYSVAEFEAQEGEAQPLHYACRKQNLPMIKYLIEAGANPNYMCTKSSSSSSLASHPPLGTPLMALMIGSTTKGLEAIKYLLSLPNVDIDLKRPSDGQTVLHVGCSTQWVEPEYVMELIKQGADVSITDNGGKTARELVLPPLKCDDKVYNMARVFEMLDKGKLKQKKRKAPTDGHTQDQDEPPAKRIKLDPETDPSFHTMDAGTARLQEWTRELQALEEDDDTGAERDDKGQSALREAIETNLQEISAGNSIWAAAAKWSMKLAETVRGISLGSDTDCDWIPFVVKVPKSKKKSSVMIAIRQAIRAPKAKLKSKNHTAKAIPYFGIEISDATDAQKTSIERATKTLKTETTGACEVRFPEEAICYPVFQAGYMAVDGDNDAVVGVYAVRVDT